MYRKILLGGCAVLPLLLAGCTAGWEDDNSYLVSARPLFPLDQNPNVPMPAATDAKDYLGYLVIDSQGKCEQFLNRLTVAETSDETGLDIASGILSALGTAFTPLSTVHALTAAASITSAGKTAIDSDFYAKATIANFQQAIQASYYTDIESYTTALKTTSEQLIVPIEITNIQRIHAECSLESAEHTISVNMQSGGTPASATGNSQTVAITGPLVTGETLTLTAVSSGFPNGNEPVPYKIPSSPSTPDPNATATGLAAAVSQDSVLKPAGVTATASGSSVVLNWPSSLALTWQPPTQQTPTVVGGAHGAAALSPFGHLGTVTPATTASGLNAPAPGHKLQQ